MEPSSQEHPPQPSQEELRDGLPEGYPLKREHLNEVAPLPKAMQDRLDEIMRESERKSERKAKKKS